MKKVVMMNQKGGKFFKAGEKVKSFLLEKGEQ
jgi:hypothetical protein